MKATPILLAITLLTTTAPALAYTESGPVQVTACVVNGPLDTIMRTGISFTNGVTVVMKNTSNKTATEVTVTGNYHGRVVTDSAKLNLPPGGTAEVTRKYTPSVFYDTNAVCHVTHVEFSDGTTWSLPSSH